MPSFPPNVVAPTRCTPAADGEETLDVSQSTEALVSDACASLCGIGALEAAAFLAFEDGAGPGRVLGSHSLSPGASIDVSSSRQLAELAGEALATGSVVQSEDARLIAVPTQLGSSAALMIASRAADSWPHEACLAQVLEGSTRIASVAIERQMFSEQRVQRAADQARARMARAIHADVVQRLFAVSLALSEEGPLEQELRIRCSTEFETALRDLRKILREPAEIAAGESDLDAYLSELAREGVIVRLEQTLKMNSDQESVLRAVLDEAIRNAHKHASPRRILVEIGGRDGAIVLTVVNDGFEGGRTHSTGVGLLLAATEASQIGGVLEHGPTESGSWTVRLTLPLEERENGCDSQTVDPGDSGG